MALTRPRPPRAEVPDAPGPEVAAVRDWMAQDRFAGLSRLYAARQVAAQRGSIEAEYPIARAAAVHLHARLRQLFTRREAITTFGPYSPGQAVAMKRAGIEAIYLGGWATSAKGSATEDPGPDLASYPLSQVPDEAAGIVRALLTADRNQHFARSQMSVEERRDSPEVDFRPLIIADADTGHGGDAHVRNLIRRFVEVGVPGYHIEDQKPGAKKCGHQGGKVLVPSNEQIKRLNAARFQLDVMGVPGILVARTDAEAANLLDGCDDERDQPFILGVTNPHLPSYRVAYLAVMRRLHAAGLTDITGQLLYAVPPAEEAAADAWLARSGVADAVDAAARAHLDGVTRSPEDALDTAADAFLAAWEEDAGLVTFADAVADVMASRADEGAELEMTMAEWRADAASASWSTIRAATARMGLRVAWDPEPAKTPEGYYQVRGGIGYAIAKSLAVAPYADLLWMETKTANLDDARAFAEAIHAVHPDKMLAYNLSPSFNWDTTGMSEDEMRSFPEELGRLGYVFNFITYGGHQVDGLAAEEFTTALRDDGMLALARLQRKLRLLESPYRTPQTLVGGPRADAALQASAGLTATTKAMGAGSTQVQHLVQTEPPPRILAGWLQRWAAHHELATELRVSLRPHTAGSDVLELAVTGDAVAGDAVAGDAAAGDAVAGAAAAGDADAQLASIIFTTIQDRRGRTILSIRDQNTFDHELRRRRLMTLLHLFLIHRYHAASVHFLTPTEDNRRQCERMREMGIFAATNDEVGEIIVADVDLEAVAELAAPESAGREALIVGATA